MDNQLFQPETLFKRIIIPFLLLVLIGSISLLGIYGQRISDPYTIEVLSLQGENSKGSAIFQINCAGCHGSRGDGIVGPSLKNVSKRKSQISLIEQVISGKTPPMPKFQPSAQEMADLLTYLEHL